MRKVTGHGHIFESSGAWHTRFGIRVRGKRVAKSVRICTKDTNFPSKESVVDLARDVIKHAQEHANDHEQIVSTGRCPTCGRFTKAGENHSA